MCIYKYEGSNLNCFLSGLKSDMNGNKALELRSGQKIILLVDSLHGLSSGVLMNSA